MVDNTFYKNRSMKRKSNDTEMTGIEWEIIEPLIQAIQSSGCPRFRNMSEIVNAMFADATRWACIAVIFP